MMTWRESVEAFRQAAEWFVESVAAVRGGWDDPALGEWTVRDLVGHTSRALLTVEAYLAQPGTAVTVASPVEYYRLAANSVGDPAAVAQRGRDAGAALGDDPAASVAAIARRVLGVVAAAHPDDAVASPVGGMRLADYLPTRIFELAVHTCDLAVSQGAPPAVPDAAAAASLRLLGELAVDGGLAGPLLLAATGRGGLPPGFTVL